MQRRLIFWGLISLFCLGGVVYLRRLKEDRLEAASKSLAALSSLDGSGAHASPSPVSRKTLEPVDGGGKGKTNIDQHATNASQSRLAYRLSNTAQSVRQLAHSEHALLLANALIDTTRQPLGLPVPASLQAAPDNGAYVVQANGRLDPAFRGRLGQAGAFFFPIFPTTPIWCGCRRRAPNNWPGCPARRRCCPMSRITSWTARSCLWPWRTSRWPAGRAP